MLLYYSILEIVNHIHLLSIYKIFQNYIIIEILINSESFNCLAVTVHETAWEQTDGQTYSQVLVLG